MPSPRAPSLAAPANAYLLFSVELVGISANAAPPQVEESPQ